MNPSSEAVLEARLYEQPVLTFSTAGGELAPPEEIHAAPDAWRLTGAWTPGIDIDGKAVERWLRGLRPQNGARSAQRLRARERIERLKIQRTALGEGDIVWATPGMEYPGAVQFRSMLGGDEDLSEGKIPHEALRHEDLEGLLEQVITEMRLGSIDPRRVGYQPVTPSGSLAKFAVHRAPNDGQWYLPDRNRLSTHIVKHEDRAEMPAEAAIESICQRSLRRLGIRAAPTRAAMIGHRQVIVKRTIRSRGECRNRGRARIHQEEWACACGRDPDELIQRAGNKRGVGRPLPLPHRTQYRARTRAAPLLEGAGSDRAARPSRHAPAQCRSAVRARERPGECRTCAALRRRVNGRTEGEELAITGAADWRRGRDRAGRGACVDPHGRDVSNRSRGGARNRGRDGTHAARRNHRRSHRSTKRRRVARPRRGRNAGWKRYVGAQRTEQGRRCARGRFARLTSRKRRSRRRSKAPTSSRPEAQRHRNTDKNGKLTGGAAQTTARAKREARQRGDGKAEEPKP